MDIFRLEDCDALSGQIVSRGHNIKLKYLGPSFLPRAIKWIFQIFAHHPCFLFQSSLNKDCVRRDLIKLMYSEINILYLVFSMNVLNLSLLIEEIWDLTLNKIFRRINRFANQSIKKPKKMLILLFYDFWVKPSYPLMSLWIKQFSHLMQSH